MPIEAKNVVILNKGVYNVEPAISRKAVTRPHGAKTNDRIINKFIIEKENAVVEAEKKPMALPAEPPKRIKETRTETKPKSLFSGKTSPFLSDMLDS